MEMERAEPAAQQNLESPEGQEEAGQGTGPQKKQWVKDSGTSRRHFRNSRGPGR